MENTKRDLSTRLNQLEQEIQDIKQQLLTPGFKEPEMVLFDQCENPFYIGKFPVTQELWEAVMGRNPSYFEGPQHPVERVSWHDAQAFIQKLNEITGKAYRLPTEYEWILAATTGFTTYSGSDNIDEVAWYYDNSKETTHPVGEKMPNSLGLYDMSGNVWEWCQDRYGDSGHRVVRGGSWFSFPQICRCSIRYYYRPRYRDFDVGFRLALGVMRDLS